MDGAAVFGKKGNILKNDGVPAKRSVETEIRILLDCTHWEQDEPYGHCQSLRVFLSKAWFQWGLSEAKDFTVQQHLTGTMLHTMQKSFLCFSCAPEKWQPCKCGAAVQINHMSWLCSSAWRKCWACSKVYREAFCLIGISLIQAFLEWKENKYVCFLPRVARELQAALGGGGVASCRVISLSGCTGSDHWDLWWKWQLSKSSKHDTECNKSISQEECYKKGKKLHAFK